MSEVPPRGLRWTITPYGRALTIMIAVVSLVVSMYVGYRYVGLVDCLRDSSLADKQRTAAISAATDAERAADLALIEGSAADGRQLRENSVAARKNTDRVRAANPAPAVEPCD